MDANKAFECGFQFDCSYLFSEEYSPLYLASSAPRMTMKWRLSIATREKEAPFSSMDYSWLLTSAWNRLVCVNGGCPWVTAAVSHLLQRSATRLSNTQYLTRITHTLSIIHSYMYGAHQTLALSQRDAPTTTEIDSCRCTLFHELWHTQPFQPASLNHSIICIWFKQTSLIVKTSSSASSLENNTES